MTSASSTKVGFLHGSKKTSLPDKHDMSDEIKLVLPIHDLLSAKDLSFRSERKIKGNNAKHVAASRNTRFVAVVLMCIAPFLPIAACKAAS